MKVIATSKNHIKVFYDEVHSHAATHLHDNPELAPLLQEVITSLELTGQEVADHFDRHRVIGRCDVVEVIKKDEIVYAVRKNRENDGLVPFVKNRIGDLCQTIAVHLVPNKDASYTLSSAWIGKFNDDEPFPQSKEANSDSIAFWTSHAFIYGSQEIIPDTETTLCPW